MLGIGTWTAEIFLLFQLHRPDILPVGDLGLLTAMQRVYQLRTRPTPKRALKLAEKWRPHRSVAAWYLWRSLELTALISISRSDDLTICDLRLRSGDVAICLVISDGSQFIRSTDQIATSPSRRSPDALTDLLTYCRVVGAAAVFPASRSFQFIIALKPRL